MNTAKKLIIALLLIPVSLVLMRYNGWFGIGFTIGIILSILYGIDYAVELRSIGNPSKTQKFMLMVLTVPQVLFGLSVFTIGATIVLWVLYNNFVERQPHYTGGFLTFGMAPAFILFGLGLMASGIFKRGKDKDEPQ